MWGREVYYVLRLHAYRYIIFPLFIMPACKICGREGYENSNYCVFHYGWKWEYDLRYLSEDSRYDDRGKPNLEWEEKRENLAKNLDSIKGDFISEFHKYAKEVLESPPPRVLDMSRFVFPAFSREEWGRLWRPLGGNEDREFVDFEHVNVKPVFTKVIFVGNVNFSGWIFGDGVSFEFVNFFGDKQVKFIRARFGDGISFDGSEFKSPVSFNGAQFGNQVSFIESKFDFGTDNRVDFIRAKFGDGISFDSAEFISPVSFNGAQFGNQVSFINAKFDFGTDNRVDFIGTKFGDGISFYRSEFKSPVSFSSTQFGNQVSFIESKFDFGTDNRVDFIGTKFGDGISFDGSEFKSPVSFNGAQFGNQVSFINAKFDFGANNRVDFAWVKFGDGISFYRSEFISPVSFNGAQFGNQVSFINAKFDFGTDNRVDFIGTKFGDGISFDSAEFISPVSFNSAQFGNHVSFIESKFDFGTDNRVDFIGTKFGDGISFYRSEFKSPVSFNSAQFGNQVSFINAKFDFGTDNEVDFIRAKFGDGISFDSAEFISPVSFNSAQFGNHVSFIESKFDFGVNSRVDFVGSKFGDGIFFDSYIHTPVDFLFSSISGKFVIGNKSYIKPKIQFRFITFLSDGHIVLYGDPEFLNSISWEGTNLFQDHPRVLLAEGATWDDWPPRVENTNFDNFINSITNPNKNKHFSDKEVEKLYREVERLYRQVRLIMEYNGRFGDAGDLYLTEMYIRTRSLLGSVKTRTHFLEIIENSIKSNISIKNKIKSVGWGVVLSLFSPIILPYMVVKSFLTGKNYIEPVLYVYYGFLSGWGERHNKPLGYLFLLSLIIGAISILSEFFTSKIDFGTASSLILHTIYIMFFPFGFTSPFLPKDTNVFTNFLFFLARIFGVVLITLFVLAIRRRFSRTTSQ